MMYGYQCRDVSAPLGVRYEAQGLRPLCHDRVSYVDARSGGSPETSTCAGSGAVSVSASSASEVALSPPSHVPPVLNSALIQKKTLAEADLEVRAKLGHGNQSSAHLAWKATAGTFRCVKRFHRQVMDSSAIDCMRQEYETLRCVEMHPRIGKVFGLFQDCNFFHIELEFHEGGDFTKLKQRSMRAGVSLTEVWWGNVLKQCLEALSHVHSKGFVHCDVKEPNLMLRTTNYHAPSVVLIDFGIAQAEGAIRSTTYGTPGYIPPEVWRTHMWSRGGDIFSLGVTLLQMLIDRTPSESQPGCGIFVQNSTDLNTIAEATRTLQPPIHLIPPHYHHLRSLVRQMLSKDVSERPSACDALSDDWTMHLASAEKPLAKADNSATDVDSASDGNLSTFKDTPADFKESDEGLTPAVFATSAVLPILLLMLL
jgi:serine/threonine protein kinase